MSPIIFNVSDLSNISNYEKIIYHLKTLILDVIYNTCPEIDKRWRLDIKSFDLKFNKDNTISFWVSRITSDNWYRVVGANFPYECFCNYTVLSDALYKKRAQERDAKIEEERAKEKEIRYKKFLELKKEFEPFT